MIYINGEELDLSNENQDYKFAPIVQDYFAYISELKERFGNSITYWTKQRPKRDEKTGNLRRVSLKSWPNIQSGVRFSIGKTNHGPYSLVYSVDQVEIVNKIPKVTERNFLVRDGERAINLDNEPDFAYFLQFHNVVRAGQFYVHDIAKTATQKASAYKSEQKVRDLLWSEHSPLSQDIESLKKIARRWGLSNIDKRTPDEIRVELFESVMSGDEAKKQNKHIRGVQEFLVDTQLGANVKAGELVSIAEDRSVLVYNSTHSEYQIVYPGRLVPVTFFPTAPDQSHRKRDSLIDALVMDDSLMIRLERSLDIKHEDSHVDFDIEDIDSYKYPELQAKGAALGIKVTGIRKEDLKANIIEAVRANMEADIG